MSTITDQGSIAALDEAAAGARAMFKITIGIALVLAFAFATVVRAAEPERRERFATACADYIEASAAVDALENAPAADAETNRALSRMFHEQSAREFDAEQRVINDLPEADYARLIAIAKMVRAINSAAADPEWRDRTDYSHGAMVRRFARLRGGASDLREAALVHFCKRNVTD